MLKEFCDQKKYMLIAAAIGVIAVFLPWATVKSGMLNFSANLSYGYEVQQLKDSSFFSWINVA